MQTITIKLNYEDETILAYAIRRGYVEDGTSTPMNFLKDYWKQYIVPNINEFIEDQVREQVRAEAEALKADALTKITIE